MNDVKAKVVYNQLQLTDNNSCNYVREYGITKIFVTAPNITEIRSSTQYEVSSDGILNFNNLHLISENLNVGFFAGSGRFEGRELIAQNVDVFHRGSNDMIVNPQQSLTGEIRSTGDLIAVNQPPTVDVEQFYTGRLIFED